MSNSTDGRLAGWLHAVGWMHFGGKELEGKNGTWHATAAAAAAVPRAFFLLASMTSRTYYVYRKGRREWRSQAGRLDKLDFFERPSDGR